MPADIELLIRLSGVEYTDRTAVDAVKQVLDRSSVNYKDVELRGHVGGSAKPAAKKTTAKSATKKKTAARRKADRTGKTTRSRSE